MSFLGQRLGPLPLFPLLLSLAIHASVLATFITQPLGGSPSSVHVGTHASLETPFGVTVVGSAVRVQPALASAPVPLSRAGLPVAPAQNTVSEAPPDLPAQENQADQASRASLLAAYASQIRARIGESLRYPLALRRRGVQGRVGLKLTLGPDGQVQAHEVSEPSGSSELDQLALEAATAAQPYPAPARGLDKNGSLVLNLPIEFKLH